MKILIRIHLVRALAEFVDVPVSAISAGAHLVHALGFAAQTAVFGARGWLAQYAARAMRSNSAVRCPAEVGEVAAGTN